MKKKGYPYYRFTVTHRVAQSLFLDLELTRKWLRHFAAKGIPACVTITQRDGEPVPVVWVWGQEHHETAPNSERISGEMMEWVNGFEALLAEYDEALLAEYEGGEA